MHRKTRFVCVSDTHAYNPSEAGFKLPPGDVLIHAGDLTNRGSLAELQKTVDWIMKADYEVKIVVCGNHDISLDPSLSAPNQPQQQQQQQRNPAHHESLNTLKATPILFLQHESALIRLTRPNGPNTTFTVFGSPYSPSHQSQLSGPWAFGYDSSTPAAATALWDSMPLDTDVVVTHTPPHSHCDGRPLVGGESGSTSVGCKGLQEALQRVRPLLAVCGHVHEARGCERVRWRGGSLQDSRSGSLDGVVPGEGGREKQLLPSVGSKKMSLVDLTGRRGGRRLDNEGGRSDQSVLWRVDKSSEQEGEAEKEALKQIQTSRQETCIVNAAIVATSYPHRGGKRFNAPIVVDVELPVWGDPGSG
ncbi:Metallo-dependent phosphatase [Aspergillus campestris IBT 28561]|uniref:Metallo-dependent phosphatase n=1 Tax=Aspergillus campestris (strain IBT 28561) TaxID=1392248 RepID=A0A2I1D2W2_ASPC2|nr:Metallo-dependent phosphatase [Aspergillus campestris IBT 28561]PKY04211.1 Metallo-dependent phosphatase [Aspergillus campestris IBT 28561]